MGSCLFAFPGIFSECDISIDPAKKFKHTFRQVRIRFPVLLGISGLKLLSAPKAIFFIVESGLVQQPAQIYDQSALFVYNRAASARGHPGLCSCQWNCFNLELSLCTFIVDEKSPTGIMKELLRVRSGGGAGWQIHNCILMAPFNICVASCQLKSDRRVESSRYATGRPKLASGNDQLGDIRWKMPRSSLLHYLHT